MMTSNEPDEVSEASVSPRFSDTHWSVVLAAAGSDRPDAEEALEKVCRAYWYPLYSYVRRRGYSQHDAQDLTQEFFARLLEKKSLETVSPNQGKFRSFLLAAINNFLANQHDRATAAKRGGGKPLISLDADDTENRYLREPTTQESPDRLFERQWTVALLERALARLRQEFTSNGRNAAFDKLKGCLTEPSESGDYGPLAAELKMTPGAVAVTVHRLRQRYRDFIRAEVADTVASPAEIDGEIRFLFSVLGD